MTRYGAETAGGLPPPGKVAPPTARPSAAVRIGGNSPQGYPPGHADGADFGGQIAAAIATEGRRLRIHTRFQGGGGKRVRGHSRCEAIMPQLCHDCAAAPTR
jgi:hypothetical protein